MCSSRARSLGKGHLTSQAPHLGIAPPGPHLRRLGRFFTSSSAPLASPSRQGRVVIPTLLLGEVSCLRPFLVPSAVFDWYFDNNDRSGLLNS